MAELVIGNKVDLNKVVPNLAAVINQILANGDIPASVQVVVNTPTQRSKIKIYTLVGRNHDYTSHLSVRDFRDDPELGQRGVWVCIRSYGKENPIKDNQVYEAILREFGMYG